VHCESEIDTGILTQSETTKPYNYEQSINTIIY